MLNFWNFIWYVFWVFALIAYLMAMFVVIVDIFRDRSLNGGFKALWLIFLVFVPFLTVLVYLIARGSGMAERQQAESKQVKAETDQYIRTVAGWSPSEEIAKAKALLDEGTITQQDYEAIKAHAVASDGRV